MANRFAERFVAWFVLIPFPQLAAWNSAWASDLSYAVKSTQL